MQMTIPQDVLSIINRLNQAGFSAYIVGGCVRDACLNQSPKDWDICTSAKPEEMQTVFAGEHVVETGLKHGTLTVVLHHIPYEVTTYRVDGAYTDHRHPDGVTFVTDVRDDLSRRDFTVNAMAYHPQEGLIDAFDGLSDLEQRTIRCVGDPATRFGEDALRILRAMRFASVYDFTIEPRTASAIHQLFPTLKEVAAERIRTELCKMLCGFGVARILREFTDVITFLIPELQPCVGFQQYNRHHRFDVWEHTIQAVDAAPATEVLRLSALLHDIGKPNAFFIGEDGQGHFYGHPQKSKELAMPILQRLKVDNATKARTLLLVHEHDIELLPLTKRLLTRRLSKLGEEALRQLFDLRCADRLGTGYASIEEVNAWRKEANLLLDEIVAAHPCVSIRDLSVDGNALVAIGLPRGPLLGRCLQALLDAVLHEKITNTPDELLDYAQRWHQSVETSTVKGEPS